MGCLEAERLERPIVDVLGECHFCGGPVTSENGEVIHFISSWDMEPSSRVEHYKSVCGHEYR